MRIANEVGNVQLMQRINRLKVLDVIRARGPIARPEIARQTGLSPSSITNIIGYLMERNLVLDVGTVDSRDVGRKAALLCFNPAGHRIIAANVEADRAYVALTDLSGMVLSRKEIPLTVRMMDFEILNLIKKEINHLIGGESSGEHEPILGMGLAVSGLVQDEGRLVLSSSLKWKSLSIKEQFESLFRIPVFIQNSSRTKALWALKKHVGEADRNVVFLDLARGVGIVNYFDHRINEAVIGELGHTTVKKDGPQCFCGNRGCLELMCTVEAVVNGCLEQMALGNSPVLAELAGGQPELVGYDLALEAFRRGDEGVRAVLTECGQYLGMGIANIINLFSPQKIIINGDELLKSDFVYETALVEAGSRANEAMARGVQYQKVEIGTEESIQGLSMYVTDRLFELSDSIL